MNVLVLSDGSSASSKAIELAGFPGGALMPHHDRAQMIIVHAWEKAPAAGAVFAADALDSAAGGYSGSTGGAVAGTQGGSTGARRPATVEAALRAAVQTASSSAEGLRALPLATSTNARHGEADTAEGAAPSPSSESHANAGGPSAGLSNQLPAVFVVQHALQTIHGNKHLKEGLNYKIETTVLSPTPTAASQEVEVETEAVTPRSKSARKRLVAAASAAVVASGTSAGPTAAADTQAKEEDAAGSSGHAAWDEAERLRTHRAESIVQYAADRAVHHKAKALVLGVGSHQEGKTVTVGSVAMQALRALRKDWLLQYVKADGYTLRPSTTQIRYVVVIPLLEAGQHATQEAAGLVAVRQAQAWCRAGSKDTVAVVLVAEPSAQQDAEMQEMISPCTDRLAAILAEARTAEPTATAPAAAGDVVVRPADEKSNGAEPDATTTAETAAETADWPPVSVCELKPTKHMATPTLALPAAAAQVAKYIQQRKAEVVLVSAVAPEPLQLALMAMAKPHCVVVPPPPLPA